MSEVFARRCRYGRGCAALSLPLSGVTRPPARWLCLSWEGLRPLHPSWNRDWSDLSRADRRVRDCLRACRPARTIRSVFDLNTGLGEGVANLVREREVAVAAGLLAACEQRLDGGVPVAAVG